MLKKTITYIDYDGNERTEDFYFNLTKGELIEMEFSVAGSFKGMLERIVSEQERTKIFKIFKEMLLNAYGEKSLDGKRFVKNQELRDAFEQCGAYSIMIEEFFTDVNAAITFINGIVPAELHQDPEQLKPTT